MFATSKEAKAAGWHSRRHRTPEAQDAARAKYGTRKQRAQRRREQAEARQARLAPTPGDTK